MIEHAEMQAVQGALYQFHDDYDYVNDALSGGVILDIGCGKPRFCGLDPAGYNKWINADAVPVAPHVVPANILHLPFRDETFSMVIACRVLSNVKGFSQRQAASKELARVLRRGGRLLLLDSYMPPLQDANGLREDAGLDPLPPARTGSVALISRTVREMPLTKLSDQPLALNYYVWTRVQYPIENGGRFPEGADRIPPENYAPPPWMGVQRIWIYEKTS